MTILCCVLIILVFFTNASLLCRVGCGMNPDLTCAVTKRAYVGQRQTTIALVNSVMQSFRIKTALKHAPAPSLVDMLCSRKDILLFAFRTVIGTAVFLM